MYVYASCCLKHQPRELRDPLKAGGQAATPKSQAGRQITSSQGKQEMCISWSRHGMFYTWESSLTIIFKALPQKS